MLTVHNFIKYTNITLPYIIPLFFISFITGLLLALFFSPADYYQGEVVRIMYIHVPSAWLALGIYTLIAILSILTLIWNNITASIISHASAIIGLAFTLICLTTGSIWGKCTWGTWWAWDARLTSMLILLFLYVGYLLLWNLHNNEILAAKATSIFAIFSAINIPIIKFSVNIWSTLHQPSSILRKGGIAIDTSMLIPLLVMFTSFLLLFFILLILRSRTLLNLRKISVKLMATTGSII